MSINARKLDILPICLMFLFFVSLVYQYFWIYPAPSDQSEYVQSLSWGTTVGGYWPWLDRVALAVSLSTIKLLPLPVYMAAPIYGFFISFTTLFIAVVWLAKRVSRAAAMLHLTFMVSSFLLYHFATEIYPEPTLVLYLMVAVFCLLDFLAGKGDHRLLFAFGFCLGMAALVKIIVVPAALGLLWYSLRQPKVNEFKKTLMLGLGCVPVIIFVIFVLTYDLKSFFDMFVSFFYGNLQFMVRGRTESNNIVSYQKVFVSIGYLPVLFAPFAVPNLYRNKLSRFFTVVGLTLGFTVYAIYLVAGRAGPTIEPYIYPMVVFCSLGLSVYWGQIYHDRVGEIVWQHGLAMFFLIILGWYMGRAHDVIPYFSEGYHETLRAPLKFLLSSGVILIFCLPVLLEVLPNKKLIIVAFLASAFVPSLINTGRARIRFKFNLQPEVEYYYANAPLVNLLPGDEWDFFMEEWNNYSYPSRIATIYLHFFNKKFDFGNGDDRQRIGVETIPSKIRVLSKKKISDIKGPRVVTDSPEFIKQRFPDAKIEIVVPWRGRDISVFTL